MIEKYNDKKDNIQLEFAESGNIMVLERKFDENTGVPVLKQTVEVSSKQITDLIADLDRQIEAQMLPLQRRKEDLEAMLPDITAKELERQEIIEGKSKQKAEK